MTRFQVETSDVLKDLRVNVSVEGSNQAIWHKERFLVEDKEIIENLIHSSTNTICWSIHRPVRGWYIRIRSPMFPPGVFIPLTPVPTTAPYHTEAAMSFNSRTNIPIQLRSHDHSYPPNTTTTTPNEDSLVPSSQITQFILSPSSSTSTSDDHDTHPSFLSRALSALKSHRPSRSNSFSLSRVLHPPKRDGISSPPPPYPYPNAVEPIPGNYRPPILNTPLLVFHDQTPMLTLRSLSGLIELNPEEERTLGVDTSFWIAIALTYLEFLEERESYLAAATD